VKLAELLQIEPGITAVIGGGGKTTLLRTLGEELAQKHTVLLCTTTKIMPFSGIPCATSKEELMRLKSIHRLLCAGTPIPESGKLTAPEVSMKQLTEWFEYVLVEADGSAQRPFKAHAPHEPVIPKEANQTICVVGASGFGRPIRETVHRHELYVNLSGATEDQAVTPETEAAVLNKENLHNKIYVNQVESKETMIHAKKLAALLKCPVVAGSLQKGEYVVCSY